jgi:hypothetical protein
MATEFLPEEYGFSYPPHLPPRAAIEAAVETLVEVLNAMDGDLDAEDATGAEDAFEEHEERFGYDGPACPISDPGGGNVEDEGEGIDEREPDHDAEIETWSHSDDHPAELFIGRKS